MKVSFKIFSWAKLFDICTVYRIIDYFKHFEKKGTISFFVQNTHFAFDKRFFEMNNLNLNVFQYVPQWWCYFYGFRMQVYADFVAALHNICEAPSTNFTTDQGRTQGGGGVGG